MQSSPAVCTPSGARRHPSLHHLRMPGEGKEQKEKKKTETDQDLNHEKNRHEPAKKWRPPNPVGDYAEDRDRLEDRQCEIDDVRIVQVILVRQPAAGDQEPVNRDRRDEISDRTEDRLDRNRSRGRCFQYPTFYFRLPNLKLARFPHSLASTLRSFTFYVAQPRSLHSTFPTRHCS